MKGVGSGSLRSRGEEQCGILRWKLKKERESIYRMEVIFLGQRFQKVLRRIFMCVQVWEYSIVKLVEK